MPSDRGHPFGILVAAFAATAILSAACDESARSKAERMTGGSVDRGGLAIRRYGCGSCHVVPGVPGATASVGPPLEKLADRVYVAGNLTNDPANLAAWIRNPQHLHPPNAMPDSGVTADEARDIVAYLYSLR